MRRATDFCSPLQNWRFNGAGLKPHASVWRPPLAGAALGYDRLQGYITPHYWTHTDLGNCHSTTTGRLASPDFLKRASYFIFCRDPHVPELTPVSQLTRLLQAVQLVKPSEDAYVRPPTGYSVRVVEPGYPSRLA